MPAPLDPHAPPSTRPFASAREGRRSNGTQRPFTVLDRSFGLLVCDPSPLALDGAAVGHGLPARPIPLGELQTWLLHPSVGFDARDAALTWLVGRAQREGGRWLVGVAGVLRHCCIWPEGPTGREQSGADSRPDGCQKCSKRSIRASPMEFRSSGGGRRC